MTSDDGKEVYWNSEQMSKASLAAATPERKWRGQTMISWVDWGGVDKRRHATLVLDDGTRLQIHEWERSSEVPGGQRTGTERLLRRV